MSLASRLTRLPRSFDTDQGADAAAHAPWAEGSMRDLLTGAGGSSPHLHALLGKEAGWLEGAADDPDGAVAALCDDLRTGAPDTRADDLRRAKRRVALLTGLCDLGGVWPLETVTGVLTDFADLAVQLALEATVGHEIRRGKLPGATEDDVSAAGGMVALAMGKMGAGELNYSSDIDLICLFDETRFDRDDYHEARAALVRATRKMCAMLSDLTGEGYVFRTDLRLRPDPAVTPVCMAMEAAERYYESLGRTWERAAYIKARAAAGDVEAGERFLETLTPFVWRRHLDFAAIRDAHEMRLRIRAQKGRGGAITLPGHDMKLGRGGIREIEFFTQTRQIIAGGRDPALRVRGTVDGLRVLAEKGWVPDEIARELTGAYRAHREVEHRVQMIRDAQTHALPGSGDEMDRLACLMDTDRGTLERELHQRLERVHEITEDFFDREGGGAGAAASDEAEFGEETTRRWPAYPALRSARAVEIFDRIKPEILARLKRSSRPEEALAAFDGFLAGLPAGVQLFSLFEANPQLVDLLVDIVSVSPDLARYLSRNAGVFDAVIGGDFFAEWPGRAALVAQFERMLAREEDYERRLDAARRWGKEWHFRAGVHLLRGLTDPEEAAEQYADVAEATLAALWPVVVDEFAAKHGAPPGRGAAVLGMGSLGARRLHARSDLDLIVIYDADGVEASEGRKPLSSRVYYARLTQALVTAMTAPMAEGKLYEVDMRLRPSGNQGPVATSLASFRDYQAREAWTWEHLALTRARAVAGTAEIGAEAEAVRLDVLAATRDRSDTLGEVARMRARIEAAKGQGALWDPKIGRGRMQEIELLAQAGTLVAGADTRDVAGGLEAGVACGWLVADDAAELATAHRLLWALQIGARLLSDGPVSPDDLGQGAAEVLTRLTRTESMDDLAGRLRAATERAGRAVDAALGQADAA
ncbi:Glutamate-ammonia-ligase adenylyltransferase [Roseivivax jejudonensis]|uniref:Glutamate-ammonia-ligase adenylyltransferase n=1 Tax=Roseivivax jejudonensis TaxID=1529041 RepID=A0A1X6Z508_9RHOB|nr:glutamine-synthetase adenylyltransferase [Roseivivax jejudonensis]SLN38994.1 Glutamate-ammonia-ligase adenylyltransferase [Roseivivax jejudonensis]